MDEAAFREHLRSRHLDPETVERSVAGVRRFETYVQREEPGATIDRATVEDVRRYVEELDRTGEASPEDLLAVGRYERLVRTDRVVVEILERIDGADVPERLRQKLGQLAGPERRDEVFEALDIPSVAASPVEKIGFMGALIDRLFDLIDPAVATTVMTSGLHYEPKEVFTEERERFLAAPDIDWFIRDEHRRYVEFLTTLKDGGDLYFTQYITDDVIAYVRDTPTCGGGVRQGEAIHVTKIPYQADLYLHESDEQRKRYFYCHCPWAKESIRHAWARVSPQFCQCSAGFEKQYWDAVLDQPVQVDVVRSVLQGDLVCEFAVHLPEDVVPTARGRTDQRSSRGGRWT